MDIKKGEESDYVTAHYESNSLIITKLIYNGLAGVKPIIAFSSEISWPLGGSHILCRTVEETVAALPF